MLRVLVKVATFVNGAVHKVGEEIVIAEHHFSEEVHELLEDLDPKPVADPVQTSVAESESGTPDTSSQPPVAPTDAPGTTSEAGLSSGAPAAESTEALSSVGAAAPAAEATSTATKP